MTAPVLLSDLLGGDGAAAALAPDPAAVLPTAQMDLQRRQQEQMRKRGIAAMYGATCPLLEDNPQPESWVGWVRTEWAGAYAGVQKRLHLTERNRLMAREHRQWVSATGFGPWREPPRPKDTVRAVYNMIGPALDQRVQIIAEQRPGFRTKPTTQDPAAVTRATAQQVALEYQYDQQKMADLQREAAYWSGTDGVAFWHTYWDPDAGPWEEMGVPQIGPNGVMEDKAVSQPLGDLRTETYRIEEVRVSPNATATKPPFWWILRKTIPTAQAVAEYGPAVLGGKDDLPSAPSTDTGLVQSSLTAGDDGYPAPEELYRDRPTVDRLLMYCEPSFALPEGCMFVVVGDALIVEPQGLPFGVVPMVRVTDGSSDPAFYCRPQMEAWIDSQMRVNAVLSRWIESVRHNVGAKLLTLGGSTVTETMLSGLMSLWEVRNAGQRIGDTIVPLPQFSVGQDAKELFALEKKAFEDLTGWNDVSRGTYTEEASGRAILANREQLERTFAPGVNSMARSMTDLGKVWLHGMKHGYQVPRTMAVTGTARPDLGRALTQADFSGICEVEIDPETLMPQPRALRLFLLDQMYQKGAISLQEYRRRMPFAWTRNIQSPDDDHEARAKRVADAIKQRAPVPPVLWMDDEAIHQDVLQRDVIFDDTLDPDVRDHAFQRWMFLAQQAQMKQMGGMPMMGMTGGPVDGGGAGSSGETATGMSPTTQPFLSMSPSVASAPAGQLMPETDEQRAGLSFDRTRPM